MGLACRLAVWVAARRMNLRGHVRKADSKAINMAHLRSREVTPRVPWALPLVLCWVLRSVQWRGKRPGRAGWWKTF